MYGYQSQHRRRVEMLVDACLTVAAFVTAYVLRNQLAEGPLSLVAHLALLPVIVSTWIFLLVFFHAYRSPGEASLLELCLATVRAVGAGFVVLLALVFLLKAHQISRATLIIFGALDCALLVAARATRAWAFRRTLDKGERHRRVLVVGTGNRARLLAGKMLRRSQWGISIVGFLDSDPTIVGKSICGATVLGTFDEITAVLSRHVVDEVVLAIPRGMIGVAEKVVHACEEEGVRVRLMADLFEINVARMVLDQFDGVPLLTFEPVAHEEWKLLVKRMLDVGLALLAMIVVLPMMGMVALVIRLDSSGPILFRQIRVGLGKRRFTLYKFRTMVNGAERLQSQLEHLNEVEGPVFKMRRDPRVTRVGGFLRRASLDELPQLFNVIRGDMSLVGPRPLPVRDVDRFEGGAQRKRFSVKPGITGLWQVSGRSELSFAEWVRLDAWYIDNWGLWLDLMLLGKTIPVVLRGSGAR